MTYRITASRASDQRSIEAVSNGAALDVIDDLVAGGFSIQHVQDHDGQTIAASELLDRYLAERGVAQDPDP